MNKPKDLKDGLHDDDMQALLNPTTSNSPPELDQAILSAAHDAVTRQAQAKAGASDHPWYSYWPQGLSAAAVVVLAVVLVPILVSTPQSSFDSNLESNSAIPSANLKTNNEGLSRQATDTDRIELSSESQVPAIAADATVESLPSDESRLQDEVATARSAVSEADAATHAFSSQRVGHFVNSQEALIDRLSSSRFVSESEPRQQIIFDGDTFIWDRGNQKIQGTYQFVNPGQFLARLPNRRLDIGYSREGLLWDGLMYQTE